MRPLIEVENISYTYPTFNVRVGMAAGARPAPALRGVSFCIEAGEYLAIVGANGSGKSTLARPLNALLLPHAGRVRVAGLDTREAQHWREIRRTVGMVFQQPEDQAVATIVEEDVAFGPENLGLPPAEIRARVQEALAVVGLEALRARPPHLLSAGQLQRVALAGALAMRPRCIVFDEATAMLDPAGRRAVYELLARLHREGLTIIVITHFMEEAAAADRIIALHQGAVALDGPPAAIFAQEAALYALGLGLPPAAELAQTLRGALPALTGVLPHGLFTAASLIAALDAAPHRIGERASLPPTAPQRAGPPLIAVEGLGHTYMRGTPLAQRALTDVTLTVTEHAAHGLLGATGSGKSTLLQHLNGLLRPQEGAVHIAGFALHDPRTDLRAVRRQVGLAFQQPELQIFEQYVGDEIAYGPRLLGLDRPALRERVRWAMELVGLDFDAFKDRFTFALSGGERRKVALAAILALQPRVLLLDEPTAGLDPASRRELLEHLRALQSAGMALMLSSHQMDDLGVLTTALTVMAEGRVALSGGLAEVFAQGARLHELGLGVPIVTEVADGLRARGWPLPPGLSAAAAFVEHLRSSFVARSHERG